MSDINRIIAEWMGYEERRVKYGSCGGAVFETVWFNKHTFPFPQTAHAICWTYKRPPIYTEDLNACAEAERNLTENQRAEFADALCRICAAENDGPGTAVSKAFHATASQRATALAAVITAQKNTP